ncbi:MAG: hypothetical protein AB7S26_40990 [Sandaracinaceae bacterium]
MMMGRYGEIQMGFLRPPRVGIERARWHGVSMRALAVSIVALASGCIAPTPAAPPPVSRNQFDAQVYPVLLRDCGFPECHGALTRDEARFFRIYGPGRSRLDPEADPLDPYTEEEQDRTFERARSMLTDADRAEDTLLVRKPLSVSEGGAPHMGRTAMGADVYADTEAEGYQVLLRWARTAYPEGG